MDDPKKKTDGQKKIIDITESVVEPNNDDSFDAEKDVEVHLTKRSKEMIADNRISENSLDEETEIRNMKENDDNSIEQSVGQTETKLFTKTCEQESEADSEKELSINEKLEDNTVFVFKNRINRNETAINNLEAPIDKFESVDDEQKEKKRKIHMWIIFGFIGIVLVICLVFFQIQTSKINKALEIGEINIEEEKYEEAILSFDEVLSIDEKVIAAYEGKAESYIGMEDYTNAEGQLEKARIIEYTNNGKTLMAMVYLNTDRKDEGFKLVEQVVAENPKDIKTIILVSNFYGQIEEYNKMINILENRIAISIASDELGKLYNQLITAYIKAHKKETEILLLLDLATEATGDDAYQLKKDTYQVKNPSFELAPGEYQGVQSLVIAMGNDSDKLYYTLDGTDPTLNSLQYNSAIPLDVGETTVKVIEVNLAGVCSLPIEGAYVIKKGALSESEFITTMYGGWYSSRGNFIRFGYNEFAIGRPNSDYIYYGPYEIQSLTENGGTILVNSSYLDNDGTMKTLQFSARFDFGTPGDNVVSVFFENSSLNDEYTIGKDTGNGKFLMPYSTGKSGSFELQIN